jgi:hypothetical protein
MSTNKNAVGAEANPHGWNHIAPSSQMSHHLASTTYGQTLAPNPGAKIKSWEKARIAECFSREGWWGGGRPMAATIFYL